MTPYKPPRTSHPRVSLPQPQTTSAWQGCPLCLPCSSSHEPPHPGVLPGRYLGPGWGPGQVGGQAAPAICEWVPGCSTCGKRSSSACKGSQCGVPDFNDRHPTGSRFSVSLVQAPPPGRPSELIACSPDTGVCSGATASRTRQGFRTRSCIRGDTTRDSAGVAVLPGKPTGFCGETSKQQEIIGRWQIQSQHPDMKGCHVFKH